jgi:hypothetical protein
VEQQGHCFLFLAVAVQEPELTDDCEAIAGSAEAFGTVGCVRVRLGLHAAIPPIIAVPQAPLGGGNKLSNFIVRDSDHGI